MKVLVLDNYDSFTYNLVHYIEKIKNCKVEISRNNKISISEIDKYDKIILSPGPGLPGEAGILKELIKKYAGKKPILGVCLGHQAIAEVFGGQLVNLKEVCHGIASTIKITNNNDLLFKNIPDKFVGGHYHSWIVSKENFPDCLTVTAETEEGNIMSIKHNKFNIRGVQFHPESVLTEYGEKIIENFFRYIV